MLPSSLSINAAPPSANELAFNNNDKNLTKSWRSSLAVLVCLFIVFALAICYVCYSFPELEPNEKADFIWPSNIEQAKRLGVVLKRYTHREFLTVYIGFFLTFVFLQAFAIPGTIFFCVLSGYIFNFFVALVTCCLCSAIGATCCYLISSLVGKPILMRYFRSRVLSWSTTVSANKHHLLYYMIFLRVTPFLPNWFINVTSPVINVPIHTFFIGTLLGVAPPCAVYIQAGATLQQLTSVGDIFPWTSIVILGLFATVSLVPVLFKRKIAEHFE